MLAAQVAEAGVNYFLCRVAFGDLSFNESLRSVELFAREVMPALAALVLRLRGARDVRSVVEIGAGRRVDLAILADPGRQGHTTVGWDPGVATGAGGTQPTSHLTTALLLAALAAVVTAGFVVVVRRRLRAA